MNNLHRRLTDNGRFYLVGALFVLASLALCTLYEVPSRFGPVGW